MLIQEQCWRIFKKFDNKFSAALKGNKSSKKIFSDKCIKSFKGKKSIVVIETLQSKYDQLFNNNPSAYDNIPKLLLESKNEALSIRDIEHDDIFTKSLVKSNQSNFSKMIEKMNNLDWVSQGKEMIDNKLCPFCQQTLSANIIL